MAPSGRRCQYLVDQSETLLDLANAHPDACIDIARGQHRHLEFKPIIGRIGVRLARIEGAAAGAADVTAAAELVHQFGGHHPGLDGAILQRSGVVVELDEAGKAPPDFRKRVFYVYAAIGSDVAGDAARDDPVHHQPMAKAGVGGAQDAFAQDAAMRMHERERGVVADRADIAEVIGQSLELGHQCAQILRAGRNGDVQRRFHGVGESERVGNSAVARGAPRKLRRLLDGRARHQQLDALMDIAEALFEPHDGFAIGGEAEVSRLNDAGVNRTDRNAVQAFALHRQERVGRSFAGLLRICVQRMLNIPEAEIEPRPRIRRADRLEAIEAFDCTLEPDRGRMHGAH